MAKKYAHIKNPLTVIAIFATFAEVGGTIVLPLLEGEVQERYVWFLMAFPVLLVWLFFRVLWHKHEVLYAPKDYRDDINFLSAKGITQASPTSVIAKVIDEASQAGTGVLIDDSIGPETQATFGSDEFNNGTVQEDACYEEEPSYEPESEAKPSVLEGNVQKSGADTASAVWSAAAAAAARTPSLKNYEAIAAAAGMSVPGAGLGGIAAATGFASMLRARVKTEEHVFKVLSKNDKSAFLRNVSVRGIPDHVFSGVSTRPDKTILVEIVSSSQILKSRKRIDELMKKVSDYYHGQCSQDDSSFKFVIAVVEEPPSDLAVKLLRDLVSKYNVPVEIHQIEMP
ncbi:hypothetical protein [Pseudomonas aeruginosa]|uniref:hypothetical protein n=1 Tax=Pseudomonas aeruginosa TaxID=287 RepID=UPI0026E9E91D|nr:hypothetical protein [Pseudomonas aeruginosa]